MPREVFEEAGIHATARRLAWVHVTRPIVHANGDHAQYLDHVFRMDWTGGEPFPADDESLGARWFDLRSMPEMSADMCGASSSPARTTSALQRCSKKLAMTDPHAAYTVDRLGDSPRPPRRPT